MILRPEGTTTTMARTPKSTTPVSITATLLPSTDGQAPPALTDEQIAAIEREKAGLIAGLRARALADDDGAAREQTPDLYTLLKSAAEPTTLSADASGALAILRGVSVKVDQHTQAEIAKAKEGVKASFADDLREIREHQKTWDALKKQHEPFLLELLGFDYKLIGSWFLKKDAAGRPVEFMPDLVRRLAEETFDALKFADRPLPTMEKRITDVRPEFPAEEIRAVKNELMSGLNAARERLSSFREKIARLPKLVEKIFGGGELVLREGVVPPELQPQIKALLPRLKPAPASSGYAHYNPLYDQPGQGAK